MAANQLLINFETEVAFGSTYAARLLGIAYPTYAAYRSGLRALPRYHLKHIEEISMVISLLSESKRHDYLESRLDATH